MIETLFTLLSLIFSTSTAIAQNTAYNGQYISGSSSSNTTDHLRLLNLARRMLSTSDPQYQTPTGTLDYGYNAFAEGAQWSGNIWTQNTYGFGYAATPFLNRAQKTQLATSYLWWFDHAGDGGQFYGGLPDVPDGLLCDNGAPDGCNYMQCGPGRSALLTARTPSAPSKTRDTIEKMKAKASNNLQDTAALGHDWILEGTLAGGLMQAENILSTRNLTAAKHFLTAFQKISNILESRRVQDGSSLTPGAQGLFYAGNGANLLAPGYGGQGLPSGCDYNRYNANCSQPGQPVCCANSGLAYLSGLTITYSALLDRMIALEKFAYNGGTRKCTKPNSDTSSNSFCLALWISRRKANDQSIPAVLVNTSMTSGSRYFLKALAPDGEKFGTFVPRPPCPLDQPCPPASRHGYFETSPNVDAVAFSVVNQSLADELYQSMLSVGPSLNPCGFTLPNFPDYDDMASTDDGGYGTWVSGGSWSTLEARVILAHYNQRRFDLAAASMSRLEYPYAELFKMDNPIAHQGCGPGMYSEGHAGNLLDIDVFGIPAAFLRGIFKYIYGGSSLTLEPRMPTDLTMLVQKFPVTWGTGQLFMSIVRDGGSGGSGGGSGGSSGGGGSGGSRGSGKENIVQVLINGSACVNCIQDDDSVVLTWDEMKYSGASTTIVVTLGNGPMSPSITATQATQRAEINDAKAMSNNWKASREGTMYSTASLATIHTKCAPNATVQAWANNMTLFRTKLTKMGYEARFEFVQAGDVLIALNHSIERCLGRADGSIKKLPMPPASWSNYKMLYNQSAVEMYFEDVTRRLFQGLGSAIASYDRANASPVQQHILHLYRGTDGGEGGHGYFKRVANENIEQLDKEILKMETALKRLREARSNHLKEL